MPRLVSGYPGALYKSFSSYVAAQEALAAHVSARVMDQNEKPMHTQQDNTVIDPWPIGARARILMPHEMVGRKPCQEIQSVPQNGIMLVVVAFILGFIICNILTKFVGNFV